MNEYLIISIDDDYNEPAGIYSGNLIDILYENFRERLQYENVNTTLSIYSLEALRRQGKNRINEPKAEKIKYIDINCIDNFSINKDINKHFIAEEIKEFNDLKPNVSVIVTNSGKIKFNDPSEKIKDEISKLSPETIEYIKSNGI